MTQEECRLQAPCTELKETIKELMAVRLEMQRVVTEMRAIADLSRRQENQDSRIEALERIAAEMSQVAKSAHKRLDNMEAGQRWLIGITITLVLGVTGLFFKFI